MKPARTTTAFGVFLCCVALNTAFAQKVGSGGGSPRSATNSPANSTSGGSKSDDKNGNKGSDKNDSKGGDKNDNKGGDKNDKGGSDTKGGRNDLPDPIKRLLEEIRSSRAKFLKDQDALQRKLKDSSEDDRARIRQELQDKREQFLEQQKDLREELLRRVNDLKDQLKDHQELIDSAKEHGSGKHRKGGND